MRKLFIAGNWKMHFTKMEALEMLTRLREIIKGTNNVDVAVCPPFVYLDAICRHIATTASDNTPDIAVGAQNMHWESSGAFTGEIAAAMLKDIGCTYVIVGHSERRTLFHENDEMVGQKAAAAFANGLLPIICVGETLEEREQEQTTAVVKRQLAKALQPLTPAQVEVATIAYEPVWAIGTGKAATPEMAQEVHQMIRETLSQEYGNAIAQVVRIQYGGSVKPANVAELMSQPDIDGALVGGASLKADSFGQLVTIPSST